MSVSSRRLALGAAAALTLAGAAVVAVAQTPAPPAAPRPGTTTEVTTSNDGRVERRVIIRRGPDGAVTNETVRGPRDGRRAGGDRMRMQTLARRDPESRSEQLRTLLQLTPAQNGALAAYIAATAPPEPGAMMPARATGPLGAVERADRAADAAARLAAEARKRADATRSFYGALTASQRKVFDSANFGGPNIVRIREFRGPPPMPPMPPMPPAPPAPPRAG